jgi:hypothetical protein
MLEGHGKLIHFADDNTKQNNHFGKVVISYKVKLVLPYNALTQENCLVGNIAITDIQFIPIMDWQDDTSIQYNFTH